MYVCVCVCEREREREKEGFLEEVTSSVGDHWSQIMVSSVQS